LREVPKAVKFHLLQKLEAKFFNSFDSTFLKVEGVPNDK
jgi:hypothetical protein